MKLGFSHIELLIVMAILAIVAVAAVPNFLEAQTRSKVSRAKSDLWKIAVAVEAYTVDYGVIPLDGDDNNFASIISYRTTTPAELHRASDIFPSCTPGRYYGDLHGSCYTFRTYMAWRGLTTPVPYLPQVLIEPFSEFIPYGHYDQITNARPPSFCVIVSCGPDRTISNDSMRIGEPNTSFGFGGRLISGFPGVQAPGRTLNNVYDPSNGTISYGEIYRLCAVRKINDFYSWSPNNEDGHGFGFPLEVP